MTIPVDPWLGFPVGSLAPTGGSVVLTRGEWDATPDFVLGDEWRVVLTGPSADTPVVRLSLAFTQTS